MLLSSKYIVTEDTTQITIYELVERPVLDDNKNPTGKTKIVEKLLGYYSNSGIGRSQAYNKLINSEISEAETLQEVLSIVKRCEEQVVDFWEEQK